MEQEYAQRRLPRSKDDMDVLHGTCECDDADELGRLTESLQPTREDLKSSFWSQSKPTARPDRAISPGAEIRFGGQLFGYHEHWSQMPFKFSMS
jgi:hypothetical protein